MNNKARVEQYLKIRTELYVSDTPEALKNIS